MNLHLDAAQKRVSILVHKKYGFENEKIVIEGFMAGSFSVWLPCYAKNPDAPTPCATRDMREGRFQNQILNDTFFQKYHQNKNILRKILYKNGFY